MYYAVNELVTFNIIIIVKSTRKGYLISILAQIVIWAFLIIRGTSLL